jgi:hypothetical protein
MPEANFTDLDKMMIFYAYKNGLKIGETISRAIESGKLVVPDNETLEVLINSFSTYEYPMYQRVLAKIGSPEFSTGGNICLAAGGLCLAGVSTQNYFETKNPVARLCYAASILCSSTAMVTGGVKAVNNACGACGISDFAMGGDAFGGAFLFLGNRAQNLGHYAEGKSKIPQFNPFRNRGFKRKPGSLTGSKGIGFIMPGCSNTSLREILVNIPYQEILLIGSTIFTIYSYGKFLIAISEKVASKFSPKIDSYSSKFIQNQAVFLINILEAKISVKRIYNFALS